MPETLGTEMLKYLSGILLLFTFVAMGVFLYDLSEVPTMKQQINYQIERNGGLTSEALAKIDEHARENFRGRYTIDSSKKNQKVDYGTSVDYQLKGTFEVQLFPIIPDITMYFNGTGVSQIR